MALVDDGRVLLVRRHQGRADYPGCWDLPGGHVEAGETPAGAARRECLDDLGSFTADELPSLTMFDPAAITDPVRAQHAST
ncbi:NUDIX hydrolase [Mobilicoccus pelagius]|uniref:Putative hydrolase n=1 Tax=Mobilicoccus pelagius NBRC 104925 TaxID=1089455 RepID=H5UQZ4_9MICO|nr:NUDIX domain-containing protein [Mobilicoccus pelagius]GAB48152.1 putative hydrolase [Mobilicoccus pelagius NBRC 104925]